MPGDTDIGLHTDDGDTFVALPFSFQLYDQTYNGVNVSTNGRLDFVCINEPNGFMSACLPAPDNICPFDFTVFPNWSDYRTDTGLSGCSTFASGCGVFTSVSGSAPNRIFNIEWRAVYFNDNSMTANFEVRLYENDPNKRFDFIFGTCNREATSCLSRVDRVPQEPLPRISAMLTRQGRDRAVTRARVEAGHPHPRLRQQLQLHQPQRRRNAV